MDAVLLEVLETISAVGEGLPASCKLDKQLRRPQHEWHQTNVMVAAYVVEAVGADTLQTTADDK